MVCNGSALDKDALRGIFQLLPPRALAICAVVCSLWHQIISSDDKLWENTCRKHAKELALRYSLNINEAEDAKTEAIRLEHRARLGSTRKHSYWQAHSGRINCSRWLMNTLVTGSSDNTVKVWSCEGPELMQLKEEYSVPRKMDVTGVEFDGAKIMAAAGTDVYVWKRGTSKVVRKLGGHNQRLCSMHYIDPEVVTGCGDGTIRFFDLYTGRCSLFLRHHKEAVTSITMSSTLHVLASGSYDCTVQLCDVTSGEKIASYVPSSISGVSCIQMLEDGCQLVAGNLAGKLDCWDLRAGKMQPIWTVHASSSALNCLHYQKHGVSLILTGANDGRTYAYSTKSGSFLGALYDYDTIQSTSTMYRSPVLSAAMGFTQALSCHADGRVLHISFGNDGFFG